ncbi:hypothetical protein Hanom_Chr02g00159161 [Helianthus anomalus]
MGCLKRLRDPRSKLLLFRSCMGVAKLLFGLRTCQPSYVGGVVSVFDKGLRNAINDIVVCGGAFFGDLQWRLTSLPTRFGGLGICSAEDASSYAFVASMAQFWFFRTTSFVNVMVGCWTMITGVRWTLCIVLFPILILAVSTLKIPPP